MDLLTTLFDKKVHQRDGFDCGVSELNRYLKNYASQNQNRNIAKTFILTDTVQCVSGFYTVSATSVSAQNLPEKYSRRLPSYPVPCAIIGRLALDSKHQGKGKGAILLADAIKRVFYASQNVAIYAVLVDAKDDKVKAFYQKHGFIALQNQPLRLFLPLEAISNWFSI